MCTVTNSSGTLSDKLNLYSSNNPMGKFNSVANPAGYATHKYSGLDQAADKNLEPPPAPPPPPDVQDGKDPDMGALTRARKAYYKNNTSTLLTGPSGVGRAQQAFGSTLLGG